MPDYEDYPVTPRTDEELERFAVELRQQLGFAWDEVPTAVAIVTRLQKALGVEVVPRPDSEMGDKEAYTTFDPPRIFVRQSVFEAGQRNEPRSRMTYAHEAVHVCLHPGLPKARVARGNNTLGFIKPYASAERQARFGSAAFLMPIQCVMEAASPDELARRCNVSKQAATIRFEQVKLRKQSRPLPDFVHEGIARLKLVSSQKVEDKRANENRERDRVWERARHIDGEDPGRLRRSDDPGIGFMIERTHYGIATSRLGWFVEDGKALSYLWKMGG
jgi:Zn-dependent peptidase ImmA (M78 family)